MARSRSLQPHTPQAGYGNPDPRDVVCARLAEQATRISRLDTQELDTTGLSGRDAALAHAIYDAAIRRWLTISRLVGAGISRPFKECQPEVQASLACGAAQMLFLDRVPDHAAVSLAVEWASRHGGRKVGGFVNAGLRRLTELRGPIRERWSDGCDEIPLADGRALGLTRPILPVDDATARLSIATSHSRAFIARWIDAFGEDETRRIALHSIRSAPTIINAVHATAPIEPGEDLEPHEQSGHYVHRGDRAGLIDLLARRPDVWVQDPASSASLDVAQGLRPRVVIDVCAGRGTKTRQLAAMFPEALIVATDSDAARRSVLAGVFAEHQRVEVTPFETLHERYAGRADLVLLDVPCSNSGVLARRVEARYRGSGQALARIARLQREIISRAMGLLSAEGRLVYATCSVEEVENGAMTRGFADQTPGLRVERDRVVMPTGGPGLPDRMWRDGSYSCLLCRMGRGGYTPDSPTQPGR
ncbi:MAG: hypothetical protein IIB55_06235 [Planctomycetes bacterium]|nr:hypothetical protein [Planctomycetota bacterium]